MTHALVDICDVEYVALSHGHRMFTSFMTATGASRFLCLPEELLIHIFRFIDLLSLLTCRGVSLFFSF